MDSALYLNNVLHQINTHVSTLGGSMILQFGRFMQLDERKSPTLTAYKFSSVQYNLPGDISKKVIAWGKKHISDDDLYAPPGERAFGREHEPHVTALYGIHTASPEKVRDLLENINPFYIELGKVSCFTAPEKFDVVKLDVRCRALHEINHLLRSKLPHTNSFPQYKPHITIAYMEKGCAEDYGGDTMFEGQRILVDELMFSSRTGGRYRIKLS